MAPRKQSGQKSVTKSFKIPTEYDEVVEAYFANYAAQLGISKGDALVMVVLVMKEHGNLPALISGGFQNLIGSLKEPLRRIEANTELQLYGSDLDAWPKHDGDLIESLLDRLSETIRDTIQDTVGQSKGSRPEAFGMSISRDSGSNSDMDDVDDLNALEQALRQRRPKFGNDVRKKK